MTKTTTKGAELYGMAYQKLQTALFKLRKYGEMRLSTYLSTRMGIEGWTFSSADIAEQTGLNRHKAYELCALLVQARIFTLKEERRGDATIYNFDKAALVNYLQGDTALDALIKPTSSISVAQPGCSDATLPGRTPATLPGSSSTTTWHVSDHLPGCSPATSGSTTSHLPGRTHATIIKNEKEDEKEREKYIHTNRACVSISLSPSAEQTQSAANEQTPCKEETKTAESKSATFLAKVKSFQAENPDYGIIIKSNAYDKLLALFKAQPALTVNELGNQWWQAVSMGSLSKSLVSLDDPLNYAGTKVERGEFDERFWVKRSLDLTFFLNNRPNILTCLSKCDAMA